MHFDMVPPKYC